jgi:hypothetical protein
MPLAISRRHCRKTGLALLFLSCALASTGACGTPGPTPPDPFTPREGELKVLFIGASYLTLNDLPKIFEGMAYAAGKEVFVARYLRPGFYLDFFAQDPGTARAIRNHRWDFVVLSGGCQTAGYPDTHHLIKDDWGRHHPFPALQELKRKVRENDPDTRLVYIMPWAFEDGLTWIPGQGDDYFAMQERIRANALHWAESLDLVLAPVGMAWREVLEWNPPEHFLHASDWNHPGGRGSYLSAAVLYSTIFGESSEEVPDRWVLDMSEAAGLRRVASRVVLDSLDLWRIPF